jgi:hypothetical protein
MYTSQVYAACPFLCKAAIPAEVSRANSNTIEISETASVAQYFADAI